jgi:hypothetical protein
MHFQGFSRVGNVNVLTVLFAHCAEGTTWPARSQKAKSQSISTAALAVHFLRDRPNEEP